MFNLTRTIYAVVKTNDLYNKNPKILTLTRTKKMSSEYIKKILKITHYGEHFKSWCELNYPELYNSNDLESIAIDFENENELWSKYIEVNNFGSEYVILKFKVKTSTIFSMLRICQGCKPIGCSYETPIE